MPRRASVVWTRPALDSLLDIVRHIQTDNPAAARQFGATIKTKVARLEKFPESGRTVPEFPASGLRELIVGDYRVIYRTLKTPASVQILAVRHGARLLESPPASS
ncbi:MAG: type II toxin-antitoxin system RelE/ParE family toxin [Nitrospiraceae bacterium]|nr:type II toxin-antitoxin system RelE/ParE family toxin [Nitrospirota bacterium]TSA03515.1 MAG: type II toxin-antitoxin system RelE/ParE family toxin [Nitrospiraceae bacterium]